MIIPDKFVNPKLAKNLFYITTSKTHIQDSTFRQTFILVTELTRMLFSDLPLIVISQWYCFSLVLIQQKYNIKLIYI